MAIWQYTVLLIPVKNFDEHYEEFTRQEETDYRKSIACFWKGFDLNKTIIAEQFDQLITYYSNKSDTCFYWKGNEEDFEDNDCSMYFDEHQITDFCIRFDLRNQANVIKYVDLIINIAQNHHLKLMNLKYEIFEAERGLILKHISESNAIKFLQNPEDFLKSL